MNYLASFGKWLKDENITTTEKSNSCYVSRLKKAINLYDKTKGAYTPLLESIPFILQDGTNSSVISAIALRLTSLTEKEYVDGNISKGYRNDVFTSINRFELWLKEGTNIVLNNSTEIKNEKERKALSKELFCESEFDISVFRSRILARLNSDRNMWPVRKFPLALREKSNWRNQIADELIVLTECGIHKLRDLNSIKIQNGILYVSPKIYEYDNPRLSGKNSARKNVGFVKAYSYRADGSIGDFRVDESSVDPLRYISIEHSPAISLILKNQDAFPELKKLDNGLDFDEKKLIAEIRKVSATTTCMLMEYSENIHKSDNW